MRTGSGPDADLTEIVTLADEALAAPNSPFARYQAREIDQGVLADAIEAETLPMWSTALLRAETLKKQGVDGEALDDLIGYLRLRRAASEQLVDSIRTEEAELYGRAIQTWRKAADAAATIAEKSRRAKSGFGAD